ncbi:hypothetical protein EDB84DRAFT_1434887 [Lactarius hengduanensis]|nr:hypothetical protein EDB84DRAFT_1434887 [Lactarius hengduanensis]
MVQYCGFRRVAGTMWAMADEDGWHLAKHFYKSIFSRKIPTSSRSRPEPAALQHHSNAQYFVGKTSTNHHGRVTSREECKFYSTKARRETARDATQEAKNIGVYESGPHW